MRPQPACWICLHSLLFPPHSYPADSGDMWNLCKQTAMPNEGQKTNASRRPHCAANGDNKLLVQNGNEDLWGGRGECVECGSGRHVLANGSPQSAHTLQLLIRRIYVCMYSLVAGRATLQLDVALSKPLIVPHSDSLTKVYMKRICREYSPTIPWQRVYL